MDLKGMFTETLLITDSKEVKKKKNVAAICYKFIALDPGCFVAAREHFKVSS